MWGRSLRMLEELATERARREELTRRVDAQQTTITFLCARVNQLETERVLLLRQLTNIDMPVPQLHVTPTVGATATNAAGPLATTDALEAIAGLGIFDDNPAHAPAGWYADGTVNYGRLPVPVPVK
jgi:hypothetical protein